MSLYEAPPDMPVNPATPSAPGPEASAEEPAPDRSVPQAERLSEVLSQAVSAERSPYQVKINEVLYDPAQSGDEAGNEWLELYNAGSEPVDLGDWTISDNGAGDRLPPLTLPPGAFVVIAASEAFRSTYPAFDGSLLALDGDKIGNGLADKGDRLILRDSAGRLADALSYGEDDTILSPPAIAVASGHSLERSPPGHDTDSAADFRGQPPTLSRHGSEKGRRALRCGPDAIRRRRYRARRRKLPERPLRRHRRAGMGADRGRPIRPRRQRRRRRRLLLAQAPEQEIALSLSTAGDAPILAPPN